MFKNFSLTKTQIRTTVRVVTGLILSFVGVVLIWFVSTKQPMPWGEQPLRIWMFDVGQGDALLIQFPNHKTLLVDGGPSHAVLTKLGDVLAPWKNSLDGVLLSHADADHVSGVVSVLEQYQIETIYETGVESNTSEGIAYEQAKVLEDAHVIHVKQGDVWMVGDVRLEVLWPTPEAVHDESLSRNNTSINLLLTYGETSILLMGDAEAMVEDVVGPLVGDIDVLKVGHHGSLTSSQWSFLESVKPEYALISLGRDNSYGHPHQTVISRLLEKGVKIFRTDVLGDVLVESYAGEPSVFAFPLLF